MSTGVIPTIHRTCCGGFTRCVNDCNGLRAQFVVDRTVVNPNIRLRDVHSRDLTLWNVSCSCSRVAAVSSWKRSSVWVVQLVLWGKFGDRTSGVGDVVYTSVD